MLVKIAAKLEVSASELLGEGEVEKPSTAVFAALMYPGAVEMMSVYAKLSPELRRALLAFARTIAGETVLKVVSDQI